MAGQSVTIVVKHHYQDLISLFDSVFSVTQNTRLIKGEDEPVYLPADQEFPFHRVVFAHGYFASALHEIAHWCIAGNARRQRVDYGYWYCPDGRNEQQQHEFELVEVKPQAIEWAFSIAAGKAFQVSTDNLNGVEPDRKTFSLRVQKQILQYLERGFPPRAERFIQSLHQFYATSPLCVDDFCVSVSKEHLVEAI